MNQLLRLPLLKYTHRKKRNNNNNNNSNNNNNNNNKKKSTITLPPQEKKELLQHPRRSITINGKLSFNLHIDKIC